MYLSEAALPCFECVSRHIAVLVLDRVLHLLLGGVDSTVEESHGPQDPHVTDLEVLTPAF